MTIMKISCWGCGKPISGSRTVIEGKWYCADCTYAHDHPELENIPRVKRARAVKQEETLFPLPPPTPKDERRR